jgi:hypothetical protein
MTFCSSASRICCLQVQRRQLQQADRLLQLGRHRQLLAEAKLEGRLEHQALRTSRREEGIANRRGARGFLDTG